MSRYTPTTPVILQLSGVSQVKLLLKRCRAMEGVVAATLASVALYCGLVVSNITMSFAKKHSLPPKHATGGTHSTTLLCHGMSHVPQVYCNPSGKADEMSPV